MSCSTHTFFSICFLRKGLAIYGAQAGLILDILLPWSLSAGVTGMFYHSSLILLRKQKGSTTGSYICAFPPDALV